MKVSKKKKSFQRILAMFMALAVVLPLLCQASGPASASSGLLTISQLKEKYPAGSKWNDSFDGSTQCAGFARLLCYEAYGSEYYTNNSDGKWKKHTNVSYIDNGLKAGDLVRYKNNGHSVFVVGVSGNNVDIADCNYDWNNTVRWTTIEKSVLKNGFTHAYSAPYPLAGSSADTPSTPAPSSDLMTVSTNAVTVNVGKTASVAFTVNRAEKFDLKTEVSVDGICSGSWSSSRFQGSGSRLTNTFIVTGLKSGSATLTFRLYDSRSGALLDTKTVDVKVTGDTSSTNLRIATWVSGKGKGYQVDQAEKEQISQGKVGQQYYFWFKAYDKNSGKLLNQLYPSLDYTVNMTITDPSGKTGSHEYKGSDANWVSFTPSAAGTYSCKATFTGKVTGSNTFNFSVAADKPVVMPEKTALTVEAGKSVTCKISVIANGGKYVDATPANENICAVSWGQMTQSGGTYTIPMVVTGKESGQTNVNFTVSDSSKQQLVSIPIPVTVTVPASPPTITVSRSSLDLYAGDKGIVNVDFELNGATGTANFSVDNSKICVASWSESGTNSKSLSIAGLAEGTATVTVELKNSSGATLTAKTIKVTVKAKPAPEPTPLTLSVSRSSIQMKETDAYADVDISWSGTVPQNCQLVVVPSGDAVNLSLRKTGTTSRKLVLTVNRQGTSVLDISIKNKTSGEVLASRSVTVTVKEQPTIAFNQNSISIAIGESKTVEGKRLNSTGYRVVYEYDKDSFPADVIENVYVSSTGTSDWFGATFVGVTHGTGTITAYLVDNSGNVAASDSCQVTVTNSIKEDVSATGGTVTALSASGYSSGIIEEDIEATDEEGGSVSSMGTGVVMPGIGFTATGSAGLTTTPPASSGSSGGILTLEKADGAAAATESAISTVPSDAAKGPGIADVSGGEEDSSSSRFTDVASDKYYYEPVMWAQQLGVTDSIKGTTLNPNGNCPRGQVVEFMWRALGCPEPETEENPFTDVSSSDSHYKAVLWAYETGVTTGTSKTAFSPGATCTRGQVMTFLWRAKNEPGVTGSNPFTDVADSAYYANAVNWAVEKGITTGTSATKFSPNDLCTRAQILTFLYRCMAWEKT